MKNCVHTRFDVDRFTEVMVDLHYDGRLNVYTIDYYPIQPAGKYDFLRIPNNWIVIAGCETDESVVS